MHHPKSNVLIVDDDLVYRFAAVRTIAATGMVTKVTECENGQEALNYINDTLTAGEELPDIIFLDINMPVMNGWDFLAKFKKVMAGHPKAVHVYIVTSSIDQSDMEHAREYGNVTDYIIKPVSKEAFARILTTVQV